MSKREKSTKISLKIFEALVYAIGKSLDESGLQGRLILQDMGTLIIERLQEMGMLQPADDPFKAVKGLSTFFSSAGLIDEMVLEKEGDDVIRVEWRNWRILGAVGDLVSKGHPLVPCPLTMSVFSLFRKNGFSLEPISEIEVKDEPKRIASQKFRLVDVKKTRSFEEESERISKAMDSEFRSPP